MEAYSKGCNLGHYFLSLMAFTHELIDHQTNNILLITWCQTMSQEVLKFPTIGATIFWAQLQV
jgi:hypothetical protein